jgi:hypothetical protein
MYFNSPKTSLKSSLKSWVFEFLDAVFSELECLTNSGKRVKGPGRFGAFVPFVSWVGFSFVWGFVCFFISLLTAERVKPWSISLFILFSVSICSKV